MKENDSGKENNYTLICVWQLCFIPLAHKAKIKGDIVENVFSAFSGVAMGCVRRQALLVGLSFFFLALWCCLLCSSDMVSRRCRGEVLF
jgi:hypothetical protein